MSDFLSNLAGTVSNSQGQQTGEALQQFEPCEIQGCKYRNEEGFCSKETCVVLNEHPQTAMMVTKICMFCGSKFTANADSMQIQLCPQCLSEAIEATRRGGDDTNALSGTINVGDEKLKSKMQSMGGGGLFSSLGLDSFSNLFGEDALQSLVAQGMGVAMSNIGNDLNNFSDMDMSKDLGEGISQDQAKEILGQGGGHPCMFCGAEIIQNPSLFFPCCPECFEKLLILTVDCDKEILAALSECDPEHLQLAGTESHCYDCDD